MNETVDYIIKFLYAAVLAGVPLMYGTLGEIITEKAGNLNLGVEGLMYMGAISGFAAGFYTNNPALALLAAFGAGVLGSLIYAILTVSFKANQNVTGLTLTIFGTGIANLFGSNYTTSGALGEGVMSVFKSVSIPGLSNLPYVGKLLFSYNSFVYFGVVLCIVLGIYINHTSQGRSLRAVGENPAAADAMGVNVTLYKYVHILLGGGICALGGAYVIIVTCNGLWTYNCINGLGWIAVALVIFAGWSPYRVIIGSLVFGALSVLRLYTPASVANIPQAIFMMLPFIATAVVLVVTSIHPSHKHQQPKSCGVNYYREDR
ncbi:MAG: ABC transporter permease [Candidatus Fimadaptatus sp.]|nr:ABC transporter permease [Candidatus Fimadaptatus sp.]